MIISINANNDMWQQWVNFIAGAWIIVSAYIGMSVDTMVANLTITGIIVAALALWGALEHQSHERHHEYRTT